MYLQLHFVVRHFGDSITHTDRRSTLYTDSYTHQALCALTKKSQYKSMQK